MATRVFASPNARRLAREQGLRIDDLTGTGPNGRIIGRDVQAAATRVSAPPHTGSRQISVRATVQVRRLLKLRDRLNVDGEPEPVSMDDLLARAVARTHRLAPEMNARPSPEADGDSLAVINLAEYGTEEFDAAVQPPCLAVLAVGAVHEQPVAKKGRVKATPVMRVTLSVDPRAIEVTVAAEWMRTFVGLLHNPVRILL
jgi:pyruvate/2-oxoglutarate dehydrogenase complex dihydrolipoamide acyltransferase (E2) component